MNPTEKLALWGAAHAAARDADRAAAQQGENRSNDLRQQAQSLRDRADSLHREIYSELGSGRKSDQRSAGR